MKQVTEHIEGARNDGLDVYLDNKAVVLERGISLAGISRKQGVELAALIASTWPDEFALAMVNRAEEQ